MAAMAMEPSSPAPRLAEPPYHHPPSVADAATPPPKPAGLRSPSPLPSPLQVSGCSLQDLLLLSPPPPSSRRHRSRQRCAGAGLDESLEMPAAGTPTPPRRRQRAAPAVASPRNARRARRRLEKEVEAEEDAARKARRRKSTRAAPKAAPAADKAAAAAAKEEDASLALVPACPVAAYVWVGMPVGKDSRLGDVEGCGKIGSMVRLGIHVLLLLLLLKRSHLHPISALCHLGVMILGLAFFKDSLPRRPQVERGRSFQLTEEDVLRASRAVLPIANSMISTAQVIFSGEPSMTLKVLPVLLFGAKYGSIITVWRLLATGFFTSFTVPKLYSCYSSQIHKRVGVLRHRALEAWKSCPRKKLVAGTAVTVCWNMLSVKTSVTAAFVAAVIWRYNYQYCKADMIPEVESGQQEQEQEMEIED
ncbi:hypothetical protein ACP70R_022019 [Stipagrostis hirtigluma subsp. patula]